MDSLHNLLADKDFDQPDEVTAIKRYVRDKFQTDVGVQLRERDIIIMVPSAALASRLRYDIQALTQVADTKKRVTFRITG